MRKPTGRLKKRQSTIDALIMMYLSGSDSQPTHSSYSGQSSLQGEIPVSMQLIMIASRHVERDSKNTRKLLWLCMPTQLLSHGQ